MNKAEFAVELLKQYALENGIHPRDTTDLSPLEKWLMILMYNKKLDSERT